ncbi:hypothetical protein [Spirosoma telluris]|uniref:hypothetical protein n=1 Tax=Spirosoma telluris TaxID=2183553 RepID=UPI001314EAB1
MVINTSALTAQNLVPNPSFEFFKKDPCLGRFRTGDEVLEDYIKDWYIPTKGTTDLWNSDSSRKGQCLLYIYDNTKAHSGHYLVGIYTSFKYDTVHFNYTNTPVNTLLEAVDYREYIQIRLTEPLTIGKVYQAKMFAARYRLSNFQTNHLGMLFSEGPIKQTTIKPPILSTPQVNDTIVIADTNWREISQSFVAQRPYSYLTIGNFLMTDIPKLSYQGKKQSQRQAHIIILTIYL